MIGCLVYCQPHPFPDSIDGEHYQSRPRRTKGICYCLPIERPLLGGYSQGKQPLLIARDSTSVLCVSQSLEVLTAPKYRISSDARNICISMHQLGAETKSGSISSIIEVGSHINILLMYVYRKPSDIPDSQMSRGKTFRIIR